MGCCDSKEEGERRGLLQNDDYYAPRPHAVNNSPARRGNVQVPRTQPLPRQESTVAQTYSDVQGKQKRALDVIVTNIQKELITIPPDESDHDFEDDGVPNPYEAFTKLWVPPKHAYTLPLRSDVAGDPTLSTHYKDEEAVAMVESFKSIAVEDRGSLLVSFSLSVQNDTPY